MINNSKPLFFLFGDIETNCLEPNEGNILEIALIYTDSDLNQVGKPFQSLVYPDIEKSGYMQYRGPMQKILGPMNEFVKNMHTQNGLISDLEKLSSANDWEKFRVKEVEQEILSWLNGLIPDDGSPFPEIRFAGHSINSLDLPFIKYHMPELAGNLSHRTLDISSQVRFITDVSKISNEEIPFGLREAGHRAMDDCVMAIEEARKYNAWVKEAFWAIENKL